ncbi:hypothetical protein FACS1894156_0400 [Bacteroidia bacterium]|nr:hypothetical protein FACS1894156_0400 [Bacteroidia bacterium]
MKSFCINLIILSIGGVGRERNGVVITIANDQIVSNNETKYRLGEDLEKIAPQKRTYLMNDKL